MKDIIFPLEVQTKLIEYVEVNGLSVVKARKKLLEEFPSKDVPTVSDLGAWLRQRKDESKKITEDINIEEKRADVLKTVGSSILAIKDIDALSILSEAIATNKMLMEQAIKQNNVQIYSAKDFIALQSNQLKLIDSYVNLMVNSQKYAIEERKIQEADDNGVSIGDASVKKALLELLQNNSGIIDSIDIPSLREELEE